MFKIITSLALISALSVAANPFGYSETANEERELKKVVPMVGYDINVDQDVCTTCWLFQGDVQTCSYVTGKYSTNLSLSPQQDCKDDFCR